MLLRAEKGFILVGEDTDGTQSPQDMGMDWMYSKNKNDFVGKRSLTLKDHMRTDRQQFVGLKTIIPDRVLDIGTPLVETFSTTLPMTLIGHVTASYFSPALGRSIALALTKAGRSRIGETICLVDQDGAIEAQIVSPRFFDPEGKRSSS
jgi:sarcosine oxidase subunit alpha